MVEGDPNRFQKFGEQVASLDIPMNPGEAGRAIVAMPDAAAGGLRAAIPAPRQSTGPREALKVQVMDPHDLWDARDDGLRGALAHAAVAEAAPRVAQAAVQQVAMRTQSAVQGAVRRTTIQLGAYSSAEAAQTAWTTARRSFRGAALNSLSPTFEAVTVNGRNLTRLKVGPVPIETAAALCRAAEVADPWCARAV
ncbi:hypothetical protein ASG17_06965 [Brevundimonas sp. Leaf363]|nr:hypothetical protein ASG17_06965 [Brevundimonas sp. Leaf363]